MSEAPILGVEAITFSVLRSKTAVSGGILDPEEPALQARKIGLTGSELVSLAGFLPPVEIVSTILLVLASIPLAVLSPSPDHPSVLLLTRVTPFPPEVLPLPVNPTKPGTRPTKAF